MRGPKSASTVLTPAEEAAIVLFHQQTLLPLDDCLYALQESIPTLSRSALHRCFQRHGISRLPPNEAAVKTRKAQFKDYPIGYLHLDFAEVQTEEGKQYLVSALDRTSKLAFAELHPQATQAIAVDFLRRVLPQVPYKAPKLLTDNGVQFRNLPHHPRVSRHPLGQLCDEWRIEQRFTKPAPPWTNGQVERMNRTVKEAAIKRFHYETTDQLNVHLQSFLQAYKFAKRLKRLQGLTPYEFVCAQWQKTPRNCSQLRGCWLSMNADRTLLTGKMWAELSPLLPGQAGSRGVTAADTRGFVEAVLWLGRTGAPWRDLPPNWGTGTGCTCGLPVGGTRVYGKE